MNSEHVSLDSRHVLPVKQPPVLCDLHLQAGLDVQQHLVLLPLPLDVHPHLAQLRLQVVHHGLQLAELLAVAALCLPQLALQSRFLPWGVFQVEERLD